ncbi:MAG: alpha/beta fold hydrolase [Pseudomonadota bacterium]|nr:alpha/beta fold hydrolase [Pseudomonadota bacterium]
MCNAREQLSKKKKAVAAGGLLAAALLLSACRADDAPAAASPAASAPSTASATASAPRAAGQRLLGTLAFTPCVLTAPMTRQPVEAQCARLPVPENPQAPTGRQIALKIAWLPADNETAAAPDPVFMLAGGPGQSALQSYPQVAHAFAEVRKKRHVILVDQRGTGGSHLLACPPENDGADQGAAEHAREAAVRSDEASAAQAARRASACAQTLSQHADLRHYTTTDAVRDLEAVRQAIGAAQVNLMGISYGTRVAQQYAMRHTGRVRALVLDSVLPNTVALGGIFARNLDDALALQFAACAATPACRSALGNPRQQLDELLARLRTHPPLVSYRDAATHAQRQGYFSADTLAGLVRMYAYMPQAAALLPMLIHEAHQGHYEAPMALAHMLSQQMHDTLAMGMQLSVTCTEDAGSFTPSQADRHTVLGQRMGQQLEAMCRVWPRGQVPANFRQPLTGSVPVLALSGEFDPVTPPRYGDEAIAQLTQARHLVLKGQGHNVIGAGCMPKLFGQFIDRPDPQALDARCLSGLSAVPPFISFNGWAP